MARINLSIPDEIKEKIDQLKTENWSKIAQDAFNNHIQLLEIKEVSMKEGDLERLRQSRDKFFELSNAEGVELGKEWALNSEYADIERVSALADENLPDNETSWALAVALGSGESPSQSEILEQMQNIFGTRKPSREAIEGFVEGVAEVMAEI
jgi:hypothetical protein